MTLQITLATENPLLPAPIEIILAVVFVLLLTVGIAKFVVPRFEATYAERTDRDIPLVILEPARAGLD